MSEFICVEINTEKCTGIEACGRCVRVCPVNIMAINGNIPVVDKKNEDECTLCNLCLEQCDADAIVIHKIYEQSSDT